MRPTIFVKTQNKATKNERHAAAERVVDALGNKLPDARLLCFFDDVDFREFKKGKATRGLYLPVDSALCENVPEYMTEHLVVIQPSGLRVNAFDHFIYLHGSRCKDLRGLTMTLAHELQHFVQYMTTPILWAAGSLLNELSKEILTAVGVIDWADMPHEREARIVAKQVAVSILGLNAVQDLIAGHILAPVDELDRRDWEFISSIGQSDSYNLAIGTHAIYQRLKPYRAELADALLNMRYNATFPDFELDQLFDLKD